MVSLASYKRRFVFVCVYLAFGIMGNLYALLNQMYQITGHSIATTQIFIIVAVISISAGLLSPQWTIQLVSGITGPIPLLWFRGQTHGQLWLPRGRTDPLAVSMVLSGCNIIITALVVLLTITLDFYYSLHIWFQSRFLFSTLAVYCLDIFMILLALFPVFYLTGLLLALLYRLALSFTTTTGKYQEFETNIPAYLLLGVSFGVLTWSMIVPDHLNSRIALWLIQILQLFAVFFMMLAIPRFALIGNQKSFEHTTAVLDRVTTNNINPDLLTFFLAGLIAVITTVVLHTALILSQSIVIRKFLIFFITAFLSGGMYYSFRRSGSKRAPWLSVADKCIILTIGLLIYVLLFSRLWDLYVTRRMSLKWILGISCLMVAGVSFKGGYLFFIMKKITQESIVSRSWGWARWLSLTLCGYGIGIFLAITALLPVLGSLKILVIVMTLIVALCLMIVWKNHKLSPQSLTSRVIISAWVLFLICLCYLHLKNGWLSVSSEFPGMTVERFGDAIDCRYHRSTDAYYTCSLGEKITLPINTSCELLMARTQNTIRRLMEARLGQLCIWGMESGIWDSYLWEDLSEVTFCGFNQFGKLVNFNKLKPVIPLQDNIPDSLLFRPNSRRFDLIWIQITPDDISSNDILLSDSWWHAISLNLQSEGILAVNWSGCQNELNKVTCMKEIIRKYFQKPVRGYTCNPGCPIHIQVFSRTDDNQRLSRLIAAVHELFPDLKSE